MNALLLATVLVIQYLTPEGQVLAVGTQYDIPPDRCEVLAAAYTNWEGEVHILARCFEEVPPIEVLLAPVKEL